MTAPTQPKQKLPAGLRWSDVWKDAAGNLVEGVREVPVDATTRLIAARLTLCPEPGGCPVEKWVPFEYDPRGNLAAAPRGFCPEHGQPLVEVAADGSSPDPVGGARQRLVAAVKDRVAARRQQAIDAAKGHADRLRTEAVAVAQQTSRDMRKHVPSITVSAAALAGGLTFAASEPLAAALAGSGTATLGAAAVYASVYGSKAWAARRDDTTLFGRAARNAKMTAREAAAATAVFGGWTVATAAAGVDPSTPFGACTVAFEVLTGCALTWAVHRRRWERLWAERRRLAELARRKAEEAARRAQEEADRLAALGNRPPVDVEETPLMVGERMAQRWLEISRASTVPVGFPMGKTWIIPEETRSVTAPIDGDLVHIGWEFTIESEPGALVARAGMVQPPLLQVREWLAAMLVRDPSTVSLVDRPEGRANRGVLLLTDKAPLGAAIKAKGPAGIRRSPDGTISAFIGRTITGEEVFEPLRIPGQPFGGLTVGHTGGGKSAGLILSLLNDLWAGIFPTLYDPKQLVDYADFVGIFPIGVTREHRDVILQSLHAERRRRERHLASRPMKDRHGRVRTQQSLWDPTKDGPPLHHYWDEFHLEAKEQAFTQSLTELFRLQRVSAIGGDIATQGGGLADFADSVLRGLLNQQRMRLYRMPDNLARLAGHTGTYMPSQLPRLPGMNLTVTADVPELPLRFAFVTRADEDDSVYDRLYAPDGTQILFAPELPKETQEVFRAEGLMDLWELGKGPDGLSKLLQGPTSPTSVAHPVPAGGSAVKLDAPDVVLAIARQRPGLNGTQVADDPVWLSLFGWGKPPSPSTVSRAAKALCDAGLLDREDGLRVTESGAGRAELAAAAVLTSAVARVPMSVAVAEERESERQLELDMEETSTAA